MNPKTLLAFIQALPASTDSDLTNDSAIKQLGNKVQLLNPSEMRPNEWGKIQTQLQTILANEKYATLNHAYQATLPKLEAVDITPDLLPTPAELKAVQPANRQIGTLGYHPGPDSESENDDEFENYEIINLAIVVLNDDKPATTSQTLLQRLNERVQRITGISE